MKLGGMQTKVVMLITVTLLACFGLLVYESTEKQAHDLLEANRSKVDVLSSSIIASMTAAMRSSSLQTASDIVDGLRTLKDVDQIRVYGREKQEIYPSASYGPMTQDAQGRLAAAYATGEVQELSDGDTLTVMKPMKNENACLACHERKYQVLGVVTVSVPLSRLHAEIADSRLWSSLNALMTVLLVVLILNLFLRKVVLTPVRRAVDVMGMMEREKDLTHMMDPGWHDEMGRLGKSFNDFIHSVRGVLQGINRVSYQVSSASTQVVVNAGSITEGAQIQARSAESTSGAIEQMNASTKEIAASANSLYESAETTSSSIMEMTASIDEIAGNTAVLSASVDSTVSSISEISASIKEVSCSVGVLSEAVNVGVETMVKIAALIEKVEGAARESAMLSEKVTEDAKGLGSGAMARAIEGMDRIKAAVDRSGDVIDRLGGRSRQIGDILGIIDEVADQTELLSLNAAILASQAGEHGKGFAVVAEEIKDLAERTASSTSEIAKLIATVQSEAAEAVEAMETGKRSVEEGRAVVREAEEILKGIVASSVKSSGMSKIIESSTAEQSGGAAQVGEAIGNISEMVGQIHRATEELTGGSEQIMREAEKVKDVAGMLKTATGEQAKGSETIIRAVEHVNTQARQIASSTSEHQKGSEDVARSIEKILSVAQENEKLAEEMSLAVEELAKHSEELKDKVASYKVASTGAEMIKLGVVPLDSPARMYRKFFPLSEYLSRVTGREVVFKLTSTFEDAVRDLGTGASDVCYMTPTTYIEAHDRYGVTLIAKAVRNGLPYSHTVIIAREGSPVERLEDLKGRSFAFGDKMSTSSYLVPLYMLSKAGVGLGDLKEHRFLGHHDDVAKAVLFGESDAGGVREATAHQYKERGLKFVKVSDNIPEFNICARKGLDEDVLDRIRSSLVSLDPKQPEAKRLLASIDKDYTGFMEARDADYMVIRDMVRKMSGKV